MLLEQNKYYIGKTNNPQFRINDHFKEVGSAWTNKYKPFKLVHLLPNCDDFDEDLWTLKYMDMYGIDNVRGGSFCEINLNEANLSTIKRMIMGSTDKCYRCGMYGHFANKCMVIKKDGKLLTVNNNDNIDEYRLFQVVSTIHTIQTINKYSFGIKFVTHILKGTANQKIKPWIKVLPYYGSMKTDTDENIKNFIHKAIDMNYIENCVIKEAIRVLKCTEYGIVFCRDYELNKTITEKPKNCGNKWTSVEIIQLKNLYLDQNMNIEQIASHHKRTTSAIREKLKKLGIMKENDLHNDKYTMTNEAEKEAKKESSPKIYCKNDDVKVSVCEYCNESFDSIASAAYHENFYCKNKPINKESSPINLHFTTNNIVNSVGNFIDDCGNNIVNFLNVFK